MLPSVVALTGYGGVVRARADGRARREAKICRLGFMVTVLRVWVVENVGEERLMSFCKRIQ